MTPSDRRLQTPLVNAAVPDPMWVPGDLMEWARAIESRCRLAAGSIARLPEIPSLEGRLHVVSEAFDEVNSIIEDSPRGALRRVLSRPVWQLGTGSPPRASLERRVQSALELVDDAIQVHAKTVALVQSLEELQSKFGKLYPSIMAKELFERRLTADVLRSMARVTEVRDAVRRLWRLERLLKERQAALATSSFNYDDWTISPDEPTSAAELASACALAVAERSRLRQRLSRTRIDHEILTRHLEEIVVPNDRATSPTAAGQASVMEELLLRAARYAGATTRGAGTSLWTSALSAGADAQAWYRARPATLRAATPNREAARPESSQTYYLMPVIDDIVLISRRWESAVRLWTAVPSLNGFVEGQVVARVATMDYDEVTRDIEPLFGAIRAESGWYHGHRRVRAKVVAEFPEGWIARVDQQGEIRKTSIAPWVDRTNDESQFRILVRPAGGRSNRPEEESCVAAPEGTPVDNGFAGFTTREVATALPDHRLAWRRDPSPRGSVANEAMLAEWELFDAMGKAHGSGSALRPLTWTSRTQSPTGHPLYQVPLALPPGHGLLLGSLLESGLVARLRTIASIAKCLHQVHALGRVLGTVHPAQFAFAATPRGPDHVLVPRAILAYAPAACRIGEKHVAVGRIDHDSASFRRINVPLLNPMVAGGLPAEADHDVFSFAACALELLATQPLNFLIVYYPDVLEVVRARSSAFAEPELALKIAEHMARFSFDKLRRFFDAIAAGTPARAADWIAFL